MSNKMMALGMLVGRQIAGMRRVIKEPVAYLYNGVRLPKLPEWDRGKYPYVSIGLSIWSEIFAICSATPITAEENGYIAESGIAHYAMDEEGKSLYFPNGFNGDFSGTEKCCWYYANVPVQPQTHKSFWSNHDILYEDGSVCLAGSDPIPIYDDLVSKYKNVFYE